MFSNDDSIMAVIGSSNESYAVGISTDRRDSGGVPRGSQSDESDNGSVDDGSKVPSLLGSSCKRDDDAVGSA